MAIYLYRIRCGILLVLAGLSSCGEPSSSDTKNTEVSGELIYQKYCVACHGINGKLKSGNAADLSLSVMSDDSIRRVILYGNNKGMGPYKSIIKSDEEIKLLVEHVKTLRKD